MTKIKISKFFFFLFFFFTEVVFLVCNVGTSWALRACRSSAAVAEKKNSRATIYLFARDVMTSAHRAGGHSDLFWWRNTNWRVRTVCCKRYPLSSKATAIAADATSMEAVYAIIPVKCLRRRSQKKEKKNNSWVWRHAGIPWVENPLAMSGFPHREHSP